MKKKAIVLNESVIAGIFAGTDFGGSEKTDVGRRGLMSECVLKRAVGYHDGHTIEGICIDAGLLTDTGRPSKAGVRWAFSQLYKPSSTSILERLQNAEAERTSEARSGDLFNASLRVHAKEIVEYILRGNGGRIVPKAIYAAAWEIQYALNRTHSAEAE